MELYVNEEDASNLLSCLLLHEGLTGSKVAKKLYDDFSAQLGWDEPRDATKDTIRAYAEVKQ